MLLGRLCEPWRAGTWILTKAELIFHLRELLRSFWGHSRKKLVCLEHLSALHSKHPAYIFCSVPHYFPTRSRGQPLPIPCTAPPFTFPKRNLHRLNSSATTPRKPSRLLQPEVRLSHVATRMGQGPSISFNRGTEGISLLGPVLSAGIGDEISTTEAPMDLTSKQQAQLRGCWGSIELCGAPGKA